MDVENLIKMVDSTAATTHCLNSSILGKRETTISKDGGPTEKVWRSSEDCSHTDICEDKENISNNTKKSENSTTITNGSTNNVSKTNKTNLDNGKQITQNNQSMLKDQQNINKGPMTYEEMDMEFCKNWGTSPSLCWGVDTTASKPASASSCVNEGSGSNLNDEIDTEISKIKSRRSSVRPRKSLSTSDRRRSRRSTVDIFEMCSNNLEDCNDILQKQDLPYTTKVSQLFRLGLRKALTETEEKYSSSRNFQKLKEVILSNSEVLCSQIATDIVARKISNLTFDKKNAEEEKRTAALVEDYKSRTEVLRKEHYAWKEEIKRRKLRFKQAERELKEAESGETRLEEEVVQEILSTEEKEILAAKPNYQHFLENAKLWNSQMLHVKEEVHKSKKILATQLQFIKVANDAGFEELEKDFKECNIEMTFEAFAVSAASAADPSDPSATLQHI